MWSEKVIPEDKRFLVEEVLLREPEDLDPKVREKLHVIRRDRVSKPVFFVSAGTCGHVAGAANTTQAVREYLDTRSLEADIIEVGCIGLCVAEPLLDVQLPGRNRISFERVTGDKVTSVLDAVFHHFVPTEFVSCQYMTSTQQAWEGVPAIHSLPFFAGQTRVVLRHCGVIDPCNIDESIARGGYRSFVKTILNYTREEACEVVDKSGLRGRGGGGYPAGQKWKIALSTPGDQKYLICNADESDPGAFMDRAIMEGDPHSLIEGIAIAAYAVGASRAFIYIRSDYTLAISRLKKALDQANRYGLLGHNIYDSGYSLDIDIKKGAGAFICGEETALIQSLEGKRGMPRSKPPYPATRGLYGKPTVVNNVETLANVPAIFQHGPAWFAGIGPASSPGTKVFALSGKIRRTGLVEIAMGTTFKEVIWNIGGGIPGDKDFKVLQIGGPSGSCITVNDLDARIDYDSLNDIGAFMGSGGMVVMDEDTCIIDIVRFFMDFIRKQSCGKCIPCREGSKRIYEILDNITRRPHLENGHTTLQRFKGVMQLESLAEVMRDTSLCGLGQTGPNPVLSTLKWFRDEYEEHIFDRVCRANVCRELSLYQIDVDKCTGCMACARKCPVNAIIGTKMNPFFIVQEKCIGCGACLDTCKFSAIMVK